IPRPCNAFMLYRKDHQPQLVETLRDLAKTCTSIGGRSSKDFSSAIAQMWHAEPEEVREQYRHRAKEEREQYKILYPEYKYSPHAKK
ncbi:high mobility group box domain-containing protein, partial [Zopfochytrium polystomum]